MIGQNKNTHVALFLFVIFSAASLLSACSGISGSDIETQNISKGVLASSNHTSSDLSKEAQPSGNQAAPKALVQPAVEDASAVAPQNIPLEPTEVEMPVAPIESQPVESVQNPPVILPQAAAPAVEPQNAPLPEVDLSLPAEPQIGFRAPGFTLQSLDGQSFNLESLRGKPLLINYWATWCVPCKQELPILEKLYREYQQKGLVVLSINALDQDSVENVQAIVNEYGMTFPVLLDQDRQFANAYQAIFFPTTFIVDANGVIREISLGDNTEAELRSSLDTLLSGGI